MEPTGRGHREEEGGYLRYALSARPSPRRASLWQPPSSSWNGETRMEKQELKKGDISIELN
jgi:hypothetical protein